MNAELSSLIQKALDYHVVDRLEDLPWYNRATGEFTDEYAIHLWLEDRLGVEKPTLTLNSDCLAELFKESTFRLLLTRAAVSQIVDKYLYLVDEKIKDRINGSYTPELSEKLFDRIRSIIDCEVGNYLRLHYTLIQQEVHKAIDKHMEATIEGAVRQQLNHIKKRLEKSLGGE